MGRNGEQVISPEDIEITRITSVPGYSKATCWKATTQVEETNFLGSVLLAHNFAVTWCAQDGSVIYQADNTTTDFAETYMHSELSDEAEVFSSSASEVKPQTSSEILIRRMVYGRTGWADYGFERSVRFMVDAQGQTEGKLTCNLSL